MKTENRPIDSISDKDMIELRKWCFDRVLTERNAIMMNMREEAPLDDFSQRCFGFQKESKTGFFLAILHLCKHKSIFNLRNNHVITF